MQGDSGASRFSANMRQHARCGAVQGDSGAPRATCNATCKATCGNMQGNHAFQQKNNQTIEIPIKTLIFQQ
jgi:hypothetical protein